MSNSDANTKGNVKTNSLAENQWLESRQALSRLLELMQTLRSDNGCAWDKAQTYQSIVPHTLEEAYEVAETIELGELDELPGELGDLLFQVVFYAQIAREEGRFDFAQVANGITDKLTRRHPHIFGQSLGVPADNAQQALGQWEALKQQERHAKAQTSLMDDIPLALPALTRANKIQKRAASVGFDWGELPPVVDKIKEEIDEVLVEVNCANPDKARIEDEIGDLLFATVNLARHLKINPEQALRGANRKFAKRFRGVEQSVESSGRAFDEHTLEQLEDYWQQAKLHTKDD
ncbi:nucleoside triphosphate pyrophosphohydrolase [Paraferrimonas sedimenticola]|uniref:Nucleoside triphosphate pyrophosphohydrolase n=1 Tax=Paraferrimonas sedimenticola TaxID=375674 RepID=A0AA37RY43_9GAMM|nr:nucleoside triphosphate pyrophosphohydrolase [Paraferrimonas sedimenticola]GLP96872.1 nucleoside triphosphate pyrophosphohydrolase [Paraferrimonas sedimenticola]